MVGGTLGPVGVAEVAEAALDTDEEDVVEDNAVTDAEGVLPSPRPYRFKRLGPPQYSV